MNRRVLINMQRKELHDILLKAGVDPAATKWTNDKKGWTRNDVDTLEVGLCYFLFSAGHDGNYSVYFRPGPDRGGALGEVQLTWNEVKRHFEIWAAHTKSEQEHVDPWQQYAVYIRPEQIGSSTENAPYSANEAQQLTRALQDFRRYLKSEIPEYKEVAVQFDAQIERLEKQAHAGAGRVDWSNQFVGMFIGMCVALSLEPERASEIWEFWKQIISGLLLP